MKKSHIVTATIAVALAVGIPTLSSARTSQGRCTVDSKAVRCTPAKLPAPSKAGKNGGGGAQRLTFR